MEKGALLEVNWVRVVLDEAHMIKDRSTRTAKASFELKSERRWCVTGTPIQNKLDDLFSLLHFLQVEPYGDFNWWNQVIMKPIRNRDDRGFTRLQNVLSTILLRRTKTQRIDNVPIVSLPPRILKVRKIPFMIEEEDFYQALWNNAKTKFNRYVEVGTVLHNYAHILELLLRLRQACDHPNLVVTSRSKLSQDVNKMIGKYLKKGEISVENYEKLKLILSEVDWTEMECLICMEYLEQPIVTPCGHLFCKLCIERFLANSSLSSNKISKININNNNNNNNSNNNFNNNLNDNINNNDNNNINNYSGNPNNGKCPCCKSEIQLKQLIPLPKRIPEISIIIIIIIIMKNPKIKCGLLLPKLKR